VNPTGGSGVLISFRAPSEEGEDCCSSFKYLMVVGAAADCLRRAFPDADTSVSGRANGVLSPVHDSPNQQRPLHGEPPLIDKGDRVTIAVAALQPCPHEYRGRGHLRRRVRDSRTHDPDDDRRFTLRVTGDGTLAVTGMDMRAVFAGGAVLLAVGPCGLRLAARRPRTRL
jgi:hypothetical protein